MDLNKLKNVFIENPEFILALSLSVPYTKNTHAYRSSVTVDFDETDVLVTVKKPSFVDSISSHRLIATKQTIAAAITMHTVLINRGEDFVDLFLERSERYGAFSAKKAIDTPENLALGFPDLNGYNHNFSLINDFFGEFLNVSNEEFNESFIKTKNAFDFLETQGLAVDPSFTPEMMVLFGLVPMQFCVRTKKGENFYREIYVNAPLWSLDIKYGSRDKDIANTIDFKIRGISFVKQALLSMATKYVETEDKDRQIKGLPVVKRKGQTKIDVDE